MTSCTLTLAQPQQSGKDRLLSVDCLRGIIMVLMALDHVREAWFPHTLSPTDLTQTTAALFFTRWITHFCAPLFVFLAGAAAFLSLSRGKTKSQLARFLLTRGCLLILLEILYVSAVLSLGMGPAAHRFVILQVIWALGWSMIVLAALIWLPDRWILLFGAVTVAGHNLLDGIRITAPWSGHFLWSVLHAPDFFRLPQANVLVLYPLIPWLGVMALGFVFGRLLTQPAPQRSERLLRLGAALCLAFLLLRLLNGYGDPTPWAPQANPTFTILAFLNVEKYPPSLAYLLMTLGPGIIALGLLERGIPAGLKPVNVFGSVPLFYYLVHFPYIGLLIALTYMLRHQPALASVLPTLPTTNLALLYGVWLWVVISLYPLCRWYAKLKKTRTWFWLRYI